jgi:hypothetical protein
MLRPLIAVILFLATGLCAEAPAAADTVPEGGAVQGATYENPYFGLAVTLPEGWSEGPPGPPPSLSGYYVLASLHATTQGQGDVLIAAQDLFFGDKPFGDAAGMTEALAASLRNIPDLHIDRPAAVEQIDGRAFQRLDYSAGGLYRAWFATDLRCHVVLFTVTATDPPALAQAAARLETLTVTEPAAPTCLGNFATASTLLHKIDLPPIEPKGLRIPVRIVIDAQGTVRQVHVLRATPAQRHDIDAALRQWQFQPYAPDGKPIALETGLLIGDPPRAP